jgi:hypothetical protein
VDPDTERQKLPNKKKKVKKFKDLNATVYVLFGGWRLLL